jgi:uncharacterized membrane protein YqjE
MMDEARTTGGLGESLRSMGRLVAGVAGNRMELLLIELQEERDHTLRLFCVAMVTLLFGVFAGVALSAAWILWLDPEHRVAALLFLALVYGAVAAVAAVYLHRQWRSHKAFTASMDEWRKDREWLRREK